MINKQIKHRLNDGSELNLTPSEFDRLLIYDSIEISEDEIEKLLKPLFPQFISDNRLDLDANYNNVTITYSGYRYRTEEELEKYDKEMLKINEKQKTEKIKNEQAEKAMLKKLIKKYGTNV